METLETLGVNSAGEMILAVILLIGLALALGLSGKMLLFGVGFVILALGGLVGIFLYGDAMIVGIVAIAALLAMTYTLTHIPMGSHSETHIYSIGRDGEIHHKQE